MTIKFWKYEASGNDFVVIENVAHTGYSASSMAQMLCAYHTGIGADGLICSNPVTCSYLEAEIFNADGTRASMCGNGLRAAALHAMHNNATSEVEIGFGARRFRAASRDTDIGVQLRVPQVRSAAHALLGRQWYDVYSGVEHAVCIVPDVDKCDIAQLGPLVRQSDSYAPTGTNVDFVEIVNAEAISVRTYEKGVERETGSCGSGALSSACLARHLGFVKSNVVKVHNRSGRALKVQFSEINDRAGEAWVHGPCVLRFSGEYIVTT